MLFFKETIAKHFLKARNWGNSGIQQQQKHSISDMKRMIKSDEIYVTKMEICMQVRKQQLELDMEQQTSTKSGKEYINAVYCHPAYLTYMQNTSCKMLGRMRHKLESRFLEEISITSDIQMTPSLWQKVRKN